MKLKFGIGVLFFIVATACNNDSSVQDNTDSARHTSDSNQGNWPGDIMGKDSIPSPETQADSSHTTLKK